MSHTWLCAVAFLQNTHPTHWPVPSPDPQTLRWFFFSLLEIRKHIFHWIKMNDPLSCQVELRCSELSSHTTFITGCERRQCDFSYLSTSGISLLFLINLQSDLRCEHLDIFHMCGNFPPAEIKTSAVQSHRKPVFQHSTSQVISVENNQSVSQSLKSIIIQASPSSKEWSWYRCPYAAFSI